MIPKLDGTHDQALRSFVASANDGATDFPIQNLPLGRFRGDSAFSTWLFRIAHNVLVSHYRRSESRTAWEAGTEVPVDLVSAEPSPEAQVLQKESLVQLLRCLERLSDRDQDVISLKFAGKLRNKEIGEIIGMQEKTVSVVLLRAMQRLRQEIEKEAAL